MNKLLIILSILFIGLTSCKEDSKKKSNTLPPLPDEIRQQLLESCNYVDYIWHDMPFSLSLNERAAIISNINAIGTESPDSYPPSCRSIGRKNFQINGEIIIDADVYFGKECNYYIFLKDEKPMYSNKFSQEGINFYSNVIGNAMKQMQQMQ